MACKVFALLECQVSKEAWYVISQRSWSCPVKLRRLIEHLGPQAPSPERKMSINDSRVNTQRDMPFFAEYASSRSTWTEAS